MQPRVLLLISCMQVLFLSVKLEADPEATITSLNLRLLQSTSLTLPANPSVHIALRLSTDHSLHDERRYLHRLKTDLRNKLSSSSGSQLKSKPSTGLVALYLLALRASCQDLPTRQSALLYLKNKLSAEKKNTTRHDVPLTDHYQYSLGVLALCVNNVRLDHSVLSGLMPHEHHRQHSFDTAAMVVLALKCVRESKVPSSGNWMYSHDRRMKAQTAVNKLMEKIQRRQTHSGKIGNIYSTSVALQFFLGLLSPPTGSVIAADHAFSYSASQFGDTDVLPASTTYSSVLEISLHFLEAPGQSWRVAIPRPERAHVIASDQFTVTSGFYYTTGSTTMPDTLRALLAVGDMERWSEGKKVLLVEAQEGAFHNPMALSQLLPVLYQKTYLDIGQMDCNNETDGLKRRHSKAVTTDHGTEPNSNQQTAFVYLTVKDMNSAVIYTAKLPLHTRMSLLGVLKEAKRNDTNFNFETKQTLWGPFLTSVYHQRAQDNTRTYWRLVTGENTPLIQGIQDYHPQPGEHILLQLSKF